MVSTPSGFGGVWAGARARKNQASKRVETTSGVIQRENSTSSSPAGSSIPASSASSRTAQARWPSSPSPSLGVDRAAGEDPDVGHELRLLAALQQQHLAAPGRSACHRAAGGRSRPPAAASRAARSSASRPARPASRFLHRPTLPGVARRRARSLGLSAERALAPGAPRAGERVGRGARRRGPPPAASLRRWRAVLAPHPTTGERRIHHGKYRLRPRVVLRRRRWGRRRGPRRPRPRSTRR